MSATPSRTYVRTVQIDILLIPLHTRKENTEKRAATYNFKNGRDEHKKHKEVRHTVSPRNTQLDYRPQPLSLKPFRVQTYLCGAVTLANYSFSLHCVIYHIILPVTTHDDSWTGLPDQSCRGDGVCSLWGKNSSFVYSPNKFQLSKLNCRPSQL